MAVLDHLLLDPERRELVAPVGLDEEPALVAEQLGLEQPGRFDPRLERLEWHAGGRLSRPYRDDDVLEARIRLATRPRAVVHRLDREPGALVQGAHVVLPEG